MTLPGRAKLWLYNLHYFDDLNAAGASARVAWHRELIQVLLVEWGVPAAAIVLDGASRNTRENAVNSKVLLEKLGCDAPLLVTSAAHMARSVASFERVGVGVFAVSADVRVIGNAGVTVFDFLPAPLPTPDPPARGWQADE